MVKTLITVSLWAASVNIVLLKNMLLNMNCGPSHISSLHTVCTEGHRFMFYARQCMIYYTLDGKLNLIVYDYSYLELSP